MLLSEIANLEPINKTDPLKVLAIADSLKDGTFSAPDLLYSGSHMRAITGSHRVEAAKYLTERGYGDLEMDALDVDEYIDNYCEENECTIDDIPYNNLSAIFMGTDLEAEVMQNEEW